MLYDMLMGTVYELIRKRSEEYTYNMTLFYDMMSIIEVVSKFAP